MFRANLVTEENISLLRDAGLDSVWMGVECGNEEVANKIYKEILKIQNSFRPQISLKNLA